MSTPNQYSRRLFLQQAILASVAAAGGGSLLAGCASGGDDTSTDTGGATSAENPFGVAADAPLDVVIFGGEPPTVLGDGHLEREPSIAHRLYDLARVSAADVFVIGSNSGVNGAIVEFAQLVKERGHRLIAITSFTQTAAVDSRHPSGSKLVDHADVALDNGAPYGDAALPLPGGGTVCAVSSITSALLAQLVVAEVVRRLLEAGEAPPVYLSANVPGGDDHNRILEARYAGRIRRTA